MAGRGRPLFGRIKEDKSKAFGFANFFECRGKFFKISGFYLSDLNGNPTVGKTIPDRFHRCTIARIPEAAEHTLEGSHLKHMASGEHPLPHLAENQLRPCH